MQEAILHFIWKHQYYNVAKATTTLGDQVIVKLQGFHNSDAGPDFEHAKLRIGDVEWNGDVEIHVKSSDWDKHQHQKDKAYNRVVLHVVWTMDKQVSCEDQTILPTLELEKLVEPDLLDKVDWLIHSVETISCTNQLANVSEITILDTIQKSLAKRLERKAGLVLNELDNTRGDWAEVTYKLLMRQMGMKVNAESFNDLTTIIPYSLIRKYSQSIFSIEALLFGSAGFLAMDKKDLYIEKLSSEFDFLASKHNLTKKLALSQWKFLRLRPSNFPTLRLAQAATLLAKPINIFDLFTEFANTEKLVNSFALNTTDYWKTHYRFGKEAKNKVPLFGKSSIDLLLLNVVAPLLAARSMHLDNQAYMDKTLELVEYIKPEKNRIINAWSSVGVHPKNGGESQGLIELYNESCTNKDCLNCSIGYNLLKR